MNKGFGLRVKSLRLKLGVSHKLLAAQSGLTKMLITRLEAGYADEGELTRDQLLLLAAALNTTASELVSPPVPRAEVGRVLARRSASSFVQHELVLALNACPRCGLGVDGAKCPNGHPNDNT
jgi:transcriptional regulator with XRE-family HTH domain